MYKLYWGFNRLLKIAGLLFSPFLFAANPWQMNMSPGASSRSQAIFSLHMMAIYVCIGIGVVVFGVMIYSLIVHRKSRGYQAAAFHENFKLEVLWTLIPFLILMGLAVPATKTLIKISDNKDADLTIKVIGSQWKWEYEYLDQGIKFVSLLSTPYPQIANQQAKGKNYLREVDREVVVPIHQKIRFIVTSRDVNHSWWVPELGIKRDAIPGFMYEASTIIEKPGIYRGQCAELCGVYHGFMPIVVRAVTQEEFNLWVIKQQQSPNKYANMPIFLKTLAQQKDLVQLNKDDLMEIGEYFYQNQCLSCHGVDGLGMPPVYPALKGSSIVLGQPVARHIRNILHGVNGTAMQAYKDILSDIEIAALVTYERNAFGNNTGELIQPADVAKIRADDELEPTRVDKVNSGGLQ